MQERVQLQLDRRWGDPLQKQRSWSEVKAQACSSAHPLQWGRERVWLQMHGSWKIGFVGMRKFFLKGKRERGSQREGEREEEEERGGRGRGRGKGVGMQQQGILAMSLRDLGARNVTSKDVPTTQRHCSCVSPPPPTPRCLGIVLHLVSEQMKTRGDQVPQL